MHRLVLGRGSDVAVHGQVSQERCGLRCSREEVFARPHAVETDEPDDPLPMGLLGGRGVVVETEYLSGRHRGGVVVDCSSCRAYKVSVTAS